MTAEDRQREVQARQKAFAAANKAAKDWRGTCKTCGQTVTGTIEECCAHRCEEPSEGVSG